MYIFPFIRTRYIKTIKINAHIDCLNNSKCSVGDILLATKQGAFESDFGTFSVKVGLLLTVSESIKICLLLEIILLLQIAHSNFETQII